MKDIYTKQWIIDNSIDICCEYDKGILTLRGLHYQLVGKGMTNDIQHYKRVVNAMIDARWSNIIDFDQFSDLDRSMIGSTEYEKRDVEEKVGDAKWRIEYWLRTYIKNKWENQPYYPEVFIEKKALQGVFEKSCERWNVALGACKGYPSLTFLHDAFLRFKDAKDAGKKLIILYFGDYDPSGEDIPRSIQENLLRFGVEVEVRRIALMEYQVKQWNLPPAPAKDTDTRTAKWDGLGQVELDAVKPEQLMDLLENAINEVFDENLYNELLEIQQSEKIEYQQQLKAFVNSLKD